MGIGQRAGASTISHRRYPRIRVKEPGEHVKAGGKVVATYCVFVPEEFWWATDAIPISLRADTQFPIPVAEE
ncbi:MAG: hypothetical protein TUN42_07225 [Dehalogenimonas sp.]